MRSDKDSKRSEIISYLEVVGCERLCLSCWMPALEEHLEEFLV